MEADQLFAQFINPFFFIKIGLIILILFYVIFAFVILRRVRIMNRAIFQEHISFLLTLIAFVNIALAILLFLLAVVIL